MADLPPVPRGSQILDQFGRLLPVWSDWFQKAFVRMGGHNASTNTELETVTTARIANGAVTADKIAAAVAGNGLAGGAGTALSVGVDGSTIEISSDALRVKDSGIPFVKLLASDWAASGAASGYFKLPSGLYVQWGVTGSYATATTTSVSFPTAFPTACRQVIVGVSGNSASSVAGTGHYGTGNYSTSAFDLYNRTSLTLTFNYIAVGN